MVAPVTKKLISPQNGLLPTHTQENKNQEEKHIRYGSGSGEYTNRIGADIEI